MYERRSYQISTIILTISLNRRRGLCWWVAIKREIFNKHFFLFTFRLRRHEKFLLTVNKFIFNWWFYFFLSFYTRIRRRRNRIIWMEFNSFFVFYTYFSAMMFDGVDLSRVFTKCTLWYFVYDFYSSLDVRFVYILKKVNESANDVGW